MERQGPICLPPEADTWRSRDTSETTVPVGRRPREAPFPPHRVRARAPHLTRPRDTGLAHLAGVHVRSRLYGPSLFPFMDCPLWKEATEHSPELMRWLRFYVLEDRVPTHVTEFPTEVCLSPPFIHLPSVSSVSMD